MQVIADLHGGDLNNPVAVAEFQEIKDKVREEVSITLPSAQPFDVQSGKA